MNTRRDFFRKGVMGIAGSVLANPLLTAWPSNTPDATFNKTKKSLGVCLVGLGYYSTAALAPALQETQNCHLAGIVTGTPAKAEAWKKMFGIPEDCVYNYETFDKLKDNEKIEIVYIVLPNSMHAGYSIRAANAGKHVICEKPMAMTTDECEAMIKACKSNKVSLSIGYRMQYEPHTQEVMRFVKDEVFGKTEFIHCAAGFKNSFDKNNWKVQRAFGGGAIMDMGVYCIQAARYCTGEEPLTVTAQGYVYDREKFTDVPETATFQLEFPSGVVANLTTSFRTTENFLHVNCQKGWYRLEPFSLFNGIKSYSSHGSFPRPEINQQQTQLDETAWRIENNIPMQVPGEEGLADIKVIMALNKAIESGGKFKI